MEMNKRIMDKIRKNHGEEILNEILKNEVKVKEFNALKKRCFKAAMSGETEIKFNMKYKSITIYDKKSDKTAFWWMAEDEDEAIVDLFLNTIIKAISNDKGLSSMLKVEAIDEEPIQK